MGVRALRAAVIGDNTVSENSKLCALERFSHAVCPLRGRLLPDKIENPVAAFAVVAKEVVQYTDMSSIL